MQLPGLLDKLRGNERREPKKFLALLLSEEVVQAAIWQVTGNLTEVVSLGSPVEWDGEVGTSSELVTAVDGTIASATEGIEGEINEVILGVPYSWTDKTGIVGSKKELIRKINKELELKPLGYVTMIESVLTYLKIQEGAPTTSIVIALSKNDLTVALLRLGRIEQIKSIERSDKIGSDVVQSLQSFGEADLPSRIIIFNNMHNLDEVAQELMQIDWMKQFKFLHLPKIETLPKDTAIRSLAVAGGSEVARALGVMSEPAIEEKVPEAAREVEELREPELLTAEEIGFGVSTSSPVEAEPEEVKESEQELEETEELEQEDLPRKVKVSWQMPRIKLPQLPKLRFKANPGKGAFFLAGLVGVIGLVAALWWYWPSAVVTVTLEPKWLDQEVPMILSSAETTVNVAGGIVPAEISTVTASGEKMIDTTGKKTVGEKAHGEVTIYNRTTLNKTFPKGTVLSAPGGLKFSLEAEVVVASKSAGVDYVDVPGKASVAVSANAIGTTSNLPAGTEMTIGSFDKNSYVAKNESALSGGTSEEIRVVAKEDQKLLASELSSELSAQLEAESGAVDPTAAVYLIGNSIKIDKEAYSAKVGEEANSVGLNLTINGTLLTYQTQAVEQLVEGLIEEQIPDGYTQAQLPIKVSIEAKEVDKEGKTVSGVAKVKIPLIPSVNQNELQKALKGARIGSVMQIVGSRVNGVTSAQVTIKPKTLPPKLRVLPHNYSRIEITLVAQSS